MRISNRTPRTLLYQEVVEEETGRASYLQKHNNK